MSHQQQQLQLLQAEETELQRAEAVRASSSPATATAAAAAAATATTATAAHPGCRALGAPATTATAAPRLPPQVQQQPQLPANRLIEQARGLAVLQAVLALPQRGAGAGSAAVEFVRRSSGAVCDEALGRDPQWDRPLLVNHAFGGE